MAAWMGVNMHHLPVNLGFLLLVTSAIVVLPTRVAVAWLVAINVACTLVLAADVIHAHFYGDALSLAQAQNARFLGSILPALGPAFDRALLLYVAEWPLVFWLARRSWLGWSERGTVERCARVLPIAVVGILLMGAAPSHLVAAGRQIAEGSTPPKRIIADVGILNYHAVDLFSAGGPRQPVTADQLDQVRSFLADHRAGQRPGP